MRKTGRPRGSGYDDAAAIGKILDLMQGEGATRRSAIIRVCGHDQLRRLELKLAARGVARNGRSKKMTSESTWDYGHRIGVDESGTTVVLAPKELAGSVLALGEEGADRTQFLLDLARSMVAAGSGLIYIDGKGDQSLPSRIARIASELGREDDVRIVDFNTTRGRSHPFNPFTSGSSAVMTRMCVDLLGYEGIDGRVWKGMAVNMFESIMAALAWKRDNGGLELNAGVVRSYLGLENIIELAAEERLPPDIRMRIFRYLKSIPCFDESKGTRQSLQARERHSYLEMQFSNVLGAVADIYGEIFMIGSRSVELDEIALNRRILLVSLPASDHPSEHARPVAKLVGASLMAMVMDLADRPAPVRWDEVASMEKPNSPVFPIMLDAVGDYMVNGMDLLAGQARSLGFCLVFADRDLDGVDDCDRPVADGVVANCRTRIGLGASGEIDLSQGDRSRRLKPMQAHA